MLVALLQIAAILSAVDASASLWPLPRKASTENQAVTLNGGFSFQIQSSSADSIVKDAADRYLSLINVQSSSEGGLKSCQLTVTEAVTPLEVIGSDESYDLHVTEDACSISAITSWGLLRGLETFSQLLTRTPSEVGLDSVPVDISDSPRYGHRGLLIDTARHYLPLAEVLRVVDSLPVNKLNVLHWHAVDAESFPLDTPSEPTMIKGAFSPSMTYSMSDLRTVSDYAFARGVQVILEIDIPGHAAAWTPGKPEIMADCFAKYYYNINDFALNPAVDLTYITVNNILGDVVKALDAKKIHLGGDEVVYGCWKNDTSVITFMQANGIASYDAMLGYFVKVVDNNVLGTSKHLNTVIHWEEVYTAYKSLPAATTIFQVWTDSSMIATLTSSGYRVIASPSNYWYLNIPANTWQVMYNYDPEMDLTSAQKEHIIGGEAALWGEFVDETNIESSLYPRASAVAERLWSDASQTATSDAATQRLLAHRCRMVNRGIKSAPVMPAGYCAVQYV